MVNRIGFACKYMHPDQSQPAKLLEELQRPLNEKSTTITWLNNQPRDVAEQRLSDIIDHNAQALEKLIEYVGSLPPELRMVRVGSGQLPAYTHSDWSYFYRDGSVRARLERTYSRIGQIARELDVRLSMHPGQFTVLASDNPDIVNRSLEEFEYHADIARWMGYGKTFQDFKINVHISGKAGPAGIRAAYGRLSPEARNSITIENDENAWGLDSCLELVDTVPIVLDIHHHFIRTGEYIQANDDRIKRVVNSWRGVRPTFHYSMSREDVLIGHPSTTAPDMAALLATGYKKGKLRAHSDFYWNTACNKWALSHLEWGDMMAESKGKNLATIKLHEQAVALKII